MSNGTDIFPQGDQTWTVTERWGDLSATGFTAIPNTLIKAQAELALTSNDIIVLMNLILHWWRPEDRPFPRITTISKRSGLGRRTVERSVQKMRTQGYITRVKEGDRVFLDLKGLKEKLAELAPEHSWAYENSMLSRKQNDGEAADSNPSGSAR